MDKQPKTGFLQKISPILGNLLGGIGSVATSLIDRKTQRASQERQNKANMELSQYQYSKQLEMWNKANEYNSPQAQMERFKSAGLNPNLIYDRGSAGTASSVSPSYQSPDLRYERLSPINPSDVLDKIMDYKIRSQQLENLKADRRMKEQNIEYQGLRNFYGSDFFNFRNRGQWLRNQFKEMDFGIYTNRYDEGNMPRVEYINYLLNKLKLPSTQLENYNSNIALTNARKDLADLDIQYYFPNLWKSVMGLGGNLMNTVIGKSFTGISNPNKLRPAPKAPVKPWKKYSWQ